MRGAGARVPPPFPPSSAPLNLDFSSIQIPGSSSSTSTTPASMSSHPSRLPPASDVPVAPPAPDLSAADQQRLLNDPVKLRDALLSRPEEVAILKVGRFPHGRIFSYRPIPHVTFLSAIPHFSFPPDQSSS